MSDNLTKDEKKGLRRQEWQEKLQSEQKKKQMSKILWWSVAAVLIIFSVWFVWAVATTPSSSSQSTSISVPKITDEDFTIGPKTAKVQLIEYADFQCPACKAYYPFVGQLLKDEQGKILYAYRFFPLSQAHKNAVNSLQAALAASKQNKFWEMQNTLFTKQDEWADLSDPEQQFTAYAKDLGLNTQEFKTDYESKQAHDFASKQEDSATNLGLTYTPSFILDGKLITNPNTYQDFKKLIDSELSKAK